MRVVFLLRGRARKQRLRLLQHECVLLSRKSLPPLPLPLVGPKVTLRIIVNRCTKRQSRGKIASCVFET